MVTESVWSTSRVCSVPEDSGVFARVQSYRDEVVSVQFMNYQLPGAKYSRKKKHTHTHALLYCDLPHAQGKDCMVSGHVSWKKQLGCYIQYLHQMTSKYRLHRAISIFNNLLFFFSPQGLKEFVFTKKLWATSFNSSDLNNFLSSEQDMTYLCISAADHSKQNLWVLKISNFLILYICGATSLFTYLCVEPCSFMFNDKLLDVVLSPGFSTSERASCLSMKAGWKGRAASFTGEG